MRDSIQTLDDSHLVKNQIKKTTCKALKDGIWIADNITAFEACIGTNINSSRFTTLLLWECLIILKSGLIFIAGFTSPRLGWSFLFILAYLTFGLRFGWRLKLCCSGLGWRLWLFRIGIGTKLRLWLSCFVLSSKGLKLSPNEAEQLNGSCWFCCCPIK